MKRICSTFAAGAIVAIIGGFAPASADEQDAINGCLNQVRTVGGPDASAGVEMLSSEYSEAGTLVTMRDAGGTVWSCIGYNDGAVGDLHATQAVDDGGGAMAGASGGEPATTTQRVQFRAGTSGAQMTGTLTPGSSTRYVLGAKNGQLLYVNVAPRGPGISYQIFNPDNSFLLDQVSSGQDYRGQLWQSGDHVVEVINRGNGTTSYDVLFSIE